MAYYENSGQVNDEAISVAGGRTFQVIQLANAEGNIIDPAQGSFLTGLEIPKHDYVFLSYTGGNLTGVVYKLGGAWDAGSKIYSGGTTVGELELVYDGSNNLVQVVEV